MILVIHRKAARFHEPISQVGEHYESRDCAKDAEQKDVAYVVKEPPPSHVETRCKNNGWQAHIEEDLRIERNVPTFSMVICREMYQGRNY